MGTAAARGMTSTRAHRFTKAGTLDAGDFRAIIGRAASAMPAVPTGTSFLIHRENGYLQNLVVPPSRRDPANTAIQFARSVAAHSEETDIPDLSHAPHVGRANYRRGFVPGSGTQAGGDATVAAGRRLPSSGSPIGMRVGAAVPCAVTRRLRPLPCAWRRLAASSLWDRPSSIFLLLPLLQWGYGEIITETTWSEATWLRAGHRS